MTAVTSRYHRRGRVFRLLRLAAVVFLIVLALPYLIAPLYRFVDPVSTVMLWRWLTGARVERTWLPIGQMAPALPRSVVASEDGQFCNHRGIDWRGLREAFRETDDLSEMRGGSTITQQVAKNLFLWQGRSYLRKALEMPLALWINLVLPKQRVLEIYLNVARLGAGRPVRRGGGRALCLRQIGECAHRPRGRDARRNSAQSGTPQCAGARSVRAAARRCL